MLHRDCQQSQGGPLQTWVSFCAFARPIFWNCSHLNDNGGSTVAPITYRDTENDRRRKEHSCKHQTMIYSYSRKYIFFPKKLFAWVQVLFFYYHFKLFLNEYGWHASLSNCIVFVAPLMWRYDLKSDILICVAAIVGVLLFHFSFQINIR